MLTYISFLLLNNNCFPIYYLFTYLFTDYLKTLLVSLSLVGKLVSNNIKNYARRSDCVLLTKSTLHRQTQPLIVNNYFLHLMYRTKSRIIQSP
jgi:hypothetical protein